MTRDPKVEDAVRNATNSLNAAYREMGYGRFALAAKAARDAATSLESAAFASRTER